MTDQEKLSYILIRRRTVNSRAELARKLGISRPTASVICENLLAQGLIAECGKGRSTGGNAPIVLSARSDKFNVIGIDFGYTDKMAAVLLDGAGNIVEKKELSFIPGNLKSIFETAGKLVRSLDSASVLPMVAIALSAIVDEESRRVLKSVNPLFVKEDFVPDLEKYLQRPVFISNRSRTAAIAEAFGGAAAGVDDFGLISLGRSVGAGFWSNGELFCGPTSSAGEIRNLRLADGSRLEEALARENIAGLPLENVVLKCADALNQIIDIMDCRVLVLSGRFADFGDQFAGLLEPHLAGSIKVYPARFGRFSAARGSAFQLVENVVKKSDI